MQSNFIYWAFFQLWDSNRIIIISLTYRINAEKSPTQRQRVANKEKLEAYTDYDFLNIFIEIYMYKIKILSYIYEQKNW